MKFLEKDLEQIIFETRNEILMEKGLYISGKKIRQLKIGNYGISDIVTITRPNFIQSEDAENKGCFDDVLLIEIYELKQDKISVSAFLQACGYYKGIIEYLRCKRKLNFGYRININLVGKSIDTFSEFIYLSDIFDNVLFYTYDYRHDGISFQQHFGYTLNQSGF